MDLSNIILIVVSIGAVLGAVRIWVGSAAGLLVFPLLYCLDRSCGVPALCVTAVSGFMIAGLAGFIGSLFYTGFKGKGHNAGPSYMGGFGGGRGGAPPGGIILSDDERGRGR